jgi:Domain of unknown function (DUF1906)
MSATTVGAAAMAPAYHTVATGTKMINFAERQVPVDQIATAGYAGVIVYVSQLRPGATFDFKPVSRSYTAALGAAGLHVAGVYQYGKPGWVNSSSDFTRGFDGGVADANTALSLHAEAGGPASAPIFFSVDDDVSADTWKSTASQWFKGINSVLGVQRTGIYGGVRQVTWAALGCADDARLAAARSAGLGLERGGCGSFPGKFVRRVFRRTSWTVITRRAGAPWSCSSHPSTGVTR